MNAELILLVNGPGELYTWARPLIKELRLLEPNARIVLGLLPCPFATGYERGIAETLPIDALASVAECLEFIAGGRKPKAFSGSKGLVIGLGGDVSFPGRIGSRLGYVAWRYSFESYWHNGLEKLLVHDAKTLQKALKNPQAKAENIGNLVADTLSLEPNQTRQENSVLLVPGSRGFQVTHLLSYFAAVAEKIPNATFHVARSSLIDDATWAVALSGAKTHDFGGVALRLEGNFAISPNGTRLEIHHENKRYELMKGCTVAITSPGTNTLELGIAGIPTVICMPLQKMELIPIENPLRYFEYLPLIGKPIKRALVLAFLSRFKFVALPNMMTDELIQPELRGNITVQEVADVVNHLIQSPSERQRITMRLEATMPKAGAAKNLAKQILERVRQ
jgi:hypothetical protein